MRKLPSIKRLIFISLVFLSLPSFAQTVQIDIRSLLNARVVTTLSKQKLVSWSKGIDSAWSAEATMSAAIKMGSKNPLALPDNGFFDANQKHPAVQLNFKNEDALNKQVRLSSKEDGYTIQLDGKKYDQLDLFLTSANGESILDIELIYDGWSEKRTASIPDWAFPAHPSDQNLYNLAENLGKWSDKNKLLEPNSHYIHGLRLHPSAKSKLKSVRIKKSKQGTLCLWGATGVLGQVDALEMEISKDWTFSQENAQKWNPATVPGCVHTDLLNNHLIKDPFFRLNEKELQWIGKTGWIYKTTFDVNEAILAKNKLELVFEGLDTYADVYLNGEKIIIADNYFRSWQADVKKLLKLNGNTLEVKFHSVYEVNLPKWQKAPYRLQAFPNNDQADTCINMYSRKPGFHYGWDWGPRLITSGIWKPVRLKAWDGAKIKNVWIQQNVVNAKQANLVAVFQLFSESKQQLKFKVNWDGKTGVEHSAEVNPGENTIKLPITIDNPRLWWTNGLGKQELYTFSCSVENSKSVPMDAEQVCTGLRSLKVIRDKDAYGKSFYVELNGQPVFMKGSCYIPLDNFQNRVGDDRYEFIIRSAAEANMNTLRVWGGGFYENSKFYELCDKYGILVWQDLMFACGMYPSDAEYLNSVKAEIAENVSRLRNFACIALYCGNNENEISWHSWGWKSMFDKASQESYENSLTNLFYKLIPDVLKETDSLHYYHPSSPIAGFKANGIDKPYSDGDIHYWGVWHGKDPFERYRSNIARFVSEYGFQSYPEFSSVKKYSIPEDWEIHTDVMHSHQRCMGDNRKDLDYGNKLILQYMADNYKVPTDFKQFLYVNQVLQAEGVKIGFEAHRRNMKNNYCMGSLFWQIDDCWPVASWSSIDYYGKWKALHYFSKKGYAPVLVSPVTENDSMKVYIVSDLREKTNKADLRMKLMQVDGKLLWSETKSVAIDANTSSVAWAEKLGGLLKDADKTKLVFTTELVVNGAVISDNIWHFVPVKDLKLEKPNIKAEIQKTNGIMQIKLSSNVLAKNVLLQLPDEYDAFFSDNYFDILPGKEQTIIVKTKLDEIKKTDLSIFSMADVP